MPRPSDILGGVAARRGTATRKVTLVGEAPGRCVRGVLLTDGTDEFAILERRQRVDGPWLRLRNVKTFQAAEFRIDDAAALRIKGSATPAQLAE